MKRLNLLPILGGAGDIQSFCELCEIEDDMIISILQDYTQYLKAKELAARTPIVGSPYIVKTAPLTATPFTATYSNQTNLC